LAWAAHPAEFGAAAARAAQLWTEALARSQGELGDILEAVEDLEAF